MITREQLVTIWMDVTWTDTEQEFEELISKWLDTHYYSDVLEYMQLIVEKLWLSFWIEELSNKWAIAFYEKWNTIIHIGYPDMSYDSINDLLHELNTFEDLVLN